MAEPETIHLLDRLSEHTEFHTAIFLTYGVDLAFFEQAVLYPLRRNGCRNNLVFVDAQRYADTIDDLKGSVAGVGLRYILLPVALGPLQSFHAKLVMLLGRERGRLLIGSGNLNFTGIGHNHEVFTCLDWTPEDPDLQRLFAQTWGLIKAVFERWGHSGEARTLLNKAEYVSEWLLSPAEPPAGIQLVYTLDEPLIDQCGRALSGEAIERITILSPFLDDGAHALSEIYSRFRPSEVRLVLQDRRTVGDISSLEKLHREGMPLQIHRFSDNERYLHAKVYLFEAAESSYLLTGSANCTRTAWLSPSANGNMEVMLLRRADSHEHFDFLLDGRIETEPLASFKEIRFRQDPLPAPESSAAVVHLLDVSAAGGLLSGVVRLFSVPDGVTGLQLRFSTTPPRFLPLGEYDVGLHTCQVPVPSELQRLLKRPLAVSVWGIDSKGTPIDLHCNELWLTNVDELHRRSMGVLTPDVRTGSYLAAMALESEREWREFYESLARLIELDVAGLKRRGGTYTASPSGRRPRPNGDTAGKETAVRLVTAADRALEQQEEIAGALYHESPFYAWLQYVRNRLPGALREPPKRERSQDTDSPSTPGDKRSRRRWTPSERLGRSFVNLVKKYVNSLINIEYMQTVSHYHILAYYPVFQRIVWLLFRHNVIEADRFVGLVSSINEGFFGTPDEAPPVLCPRLRRYMQRIWHDDWRREEVPLYALASVVLSEDPNFASSQVDEPKDDDLAAQRQKIYRQNVRVLCGVTSVTGISWVSRDIENLAQQMNEVYDQGGTVFAARLMERVEHSLSRVEAALDEWSRSATIALEKTDDLHLKGLLDRARVDYGLARFDVLAYLQDIEAQTKLCSDLIFWMRRAGDLDTAREWSETLVNLLQAQGESSRVAKELFEEGQRLFHDREYNESANRLRQSLVLAEQMEEKGLGERCRQYLGHTEFFLK